MENICVICISNDRKLCQIPKTMAGLIKKVIPEMDISELCWECMASLKHLYRLRKKALNSKEILDKYLDVTKYPLRSKTNLGTSYIFTISLCGDVSDTQDPLLTKTEELPGNTIPKVNQKLEESNSNKSKDSVTNKNCGNKCKPDKEEGRNKFKKLKRVIKNKKKSKKSSALSKKYTCCDCNETFESRGKYEYHRQKHRGRVKCPRCGRDFSSRSSLMAHNSVAHSTAPRDDSYRHYCQLCEKFFKTDCSFRKHIRCSSRHLDPDSLMHACPACNKRFQGAEQCRLHHERVHLRLNRLQCERCCRQYCSSRALRAHERHRHSSGSAPRRFICEVCAAAFKTAQVLKGHQRIHAKKSEAENAEENSK
ncbi:zinc finger protein 771-like [Battus philenor]|uniref:zinc finger protein 771-like n=1 Tax=Battus philenor TaxID=42288 RepID=UPI0035D05141